MVYTIVSVYFYSSQDSFNEKRHYDSTKKERNKKNIRLADQFHFKVGTSYSESYTAWAPYEFVDTKLLFSCSIPFWFNHSDLFIENNFVYCLDTFCLYLYINRQEH